MSKTANKYEIAGCPVRPDVYYFIEGVATANGMNVPTFTAWSMTKWAEKAMERTADHMGAHNE